MQARGLHVPKASVVRNLLLVHFALCLNPPGSIHGQRSAPAFRLANIDLHVEMTPPASFSLRHAAHAHVVQHVRILKS